MTRIMYRAILPALLTGLVWATTACTDDGSHITAKGDRLAFNVSVNKGWNSGQGRAALPRYTMQLLESDDTSADSLFLHSLVTEGIGEERPCDSTLISRAAPIEDIDGFKLFAYAYTGTWNENGKTSCPDYIYDYQVNAPDYATDYHWPIGKKLRFFAYAPADLADKVNTGGTTRFKVSEVTQTDAPTLTYTVPTDVSLQHDLLVTASAPDLAASDNAQSGGVDLTFNHLLTAVKFSVGNIDGTIKSITLRNVKYSGTCRFGRTDNTDAEEWKWTLSDDVTDFTQTFNGKELGASGTDITSGETTFMMMPQDFSSGNAQIEVVYTEGTYAIERTLAIDIADIVDGTEWLMGTTVNYKISTSQIEANRVFDIGASNVLEFTNTSTSVTKRYHVESYVEYDGGKINRSWSVAFDYNNDETYSNKTEDKPSWLTFTKDGNYYIITVKSRTATGETTEPQNSWLQEQTVTPNPYNLANSEGATEVEQTANCYIVNAAGTYSFPLVYGNAIDNSKNPTAPFTNESAYKPTITNDYTLNNFVNHAGVEIISPWIAENENADGTTIVPHDAVLVWQDAENLVTNPRLTGSSAQDYRIEFDVLTENIKQGNAIIAVRAKNDDGSYTVLWSWHIWVTDWKPTGHYNGDKGWMEVKSSETGNTYNIMSVNLGWCYGKRTKYAGDEVKIRFTQQHCDEPKYITVKQMPVTTSGGYAPFYQWGRKDPMLPSIGTSNKTYYDSNGNSSTTLSYIKDWAKSPEVIQKGILNPQTFCANGYMENTYSNLWGASNTNFSQTTHKTIYDPCPVGYKVPVADMFRAFTTYTYDSNKKSYNWVATESPNHSPTSNEVKGEWKNDGWNFETTDGGTVYFPITYYRQGDDEGTLHFDGKFWSACINSHQGNPKHMTTNATNVNPDAKGSPRAYGCAVRPVQE